MIPMTCPNCGRRGNAPADRINVRMHCPKCDAVFHLDKHGKIRVGEPHHEHEDAGGHRDHKYDEPYATSVTQLVLKSPWPVKLVLLGIVAAIGWKFFGSKLNLGPKPDDLPTMGYRVAYAFCDKKLDDLKKLAAPGTEAAVEQWYEQLRPQFRFEGPHGSSPEMYLNVDSTGFYIDTAGQTARMAINIANQLDKPVKEVLDERALPKQNQKKPNLAGYKWHGNFTLPTNWVMHKGRWKLDGTATLAELQAGAEGSPGRR